MKKTLKYNLQLGAVLALSGLVAACGKLGFQGSGSGDSNPKSASKTIFPTSPKGDRTVLIHLDGILVADSIAPMLACAMNNCPNIPVSVLIDGKGQITDQSVSPAQVSPVSVSDVSFTADLAGGKDCLTVAQEAQAKGLSLDIVAVADHVEPPYYGIGVGYSSSGTVEGSSGQPVEVIELPNSVPGSQPAEPKNEPVPMITLSSNSGPDCAVNGGTEAGTKIASCPIPVDPLPPINVDPSGYGVTLKSIQSCKLGPASVLPQPTPGLPPQPAPGQPTDPIYVRQ